jgi:hypothetical protein
LSFVVGQWFIWFINKGDKNVKKAKELETIKTNDAPYAETIGWKDIVAIMIAQFQILMPIILVAILFMGLLLFIIMKVWIRSY